MTTKRSVLGAISAGTIALGLAGFAFGQADNTNSVIAPAPTYSQRDQYDASRHAYREDAGRWNARRGLTPYETERAYGYPYDNGYPYGYPYANDEAQRRSRLRIGGPGLSVGEDSNPADYATGIYNPKP